MMNQKYLDEFYSLLRFPSISTNGKNADQLNRCAEWLAKKLGSIGLDAESVRTEKYPIVWGRAPHDPKKRTVLIYGHYDVQSPDPLELWDSPPFEPVLKNGCVFARGATDNKGQIMAHILGVEETLRSNHELPVNLHFVIEGEEEIGSPSLATFLEQNHESLRNAVVIVSDSEMLARGVPTFAYGLRGVAALGLKVISPKVDLHSGRYGGAVANPITALAQLLATLHDQEGHIAVSGFYDQVAPVQDWERDAWSKLPIDADDEILRESGAPSLFGENGFTTIERLWARPTAEVNGIGGGYQGKGIKTVIPTHAMAKLTFRLVPNQDPDQMLALVKEHLRKYLPPGVELEMEPGQTAPCYLADPRSPDSGAAVRSLREVFGGEVAFIRLGGSIPILPAFREVLGAETLLLGLGLPDSRVHSPNENFSLDNLEAGMRLNQVLLRELALGRS